MSEKDTANVLAYESTIPGFVNMKGMTKLVTRRASDGEIVDIKEQPNNILVSIRQPIIKLLGAYTGVKTAYAINGAPPVAAGDDVTVNGVTGSIHYNVNYATSIPAVTSIALGAGTTPATIFDTGLEVPLDPTNANVGRKNLAVAPVFSVDGLKVTFAILFGDNELNNTAVSEAVMYTADNTPIARTVIGSYTKLPGMFFEFYWTIGYDPIAP